MRCGAIAVALAMQASGCAALSGLSSLEEGPEPASDSMIANDSTSDTGRDSNVDSTSTAETDTAPVCAPPGAELHISPTGSDSTGNGSAPCPFKTVTAAIAAAATKGAFTTITLHKTATPTVYGTACTGGPPCDPSPIVVPSTVTAGLVIRGEGAVDDVSLSGDGTAVLSIAAKSVGLAHLTITPLRSELASTSTHGTHGIVITAPAAPMMEQAITDVKIVGKLATSSTAGTGYGIWFKSGSSAGTVIGPAVEISGGHQGIFLDASSSTPRITGDASADTVISGAGEGCLVVSGGASDRPTVTIDSGAATSSHVKFDQCGGTFSVSFDVKGGTTSSISRAAITKGKGGLRVRGNPMMNLTNVTVSDADGVGIDVADTSKLTVTSSSVTGTTGNGMWVSGFASANLDALSITLSKADGLRCDGTATMTVRNSTFLGNSGSGVFVTDQCLPDLGSATVDAKNTFNIMSQRNTRAGLCFNPTLSTAPNPNASKSTWGCGYAGTGCSSIAVSPTRGTSTSIATCATGVDISQPSGAAQLPASSPTCCK